MHFEHRLVTALLVSSFAFASTPAFSGGLVDTSPEAFADANFSSSDEITSSWWTLPGGSSFLYFAEDGDDCKWNLIEVQGATGPAFFGDYAGTSARIILDRGWVDEDCFFEDDFDAFMETNPDAEEVTYDWYAQDDEENIWYMGEDTYDGDTSGSFVAGCDGAQAGILILGDPGKGDFQRQEFYEDEAEDWSKVMTIVDDDDGHCMKTKEWTPLERGAVEHKWYCNDGDTGELVEVEELSGNTVIVELFDTNVTAPSDADLPIDPVPACP